MEKISSFKDLKIWQKGIEIVKDVYCISERLPKVEAFGLTSQMKRAAISIPSNIAEGFRRYHNKEHSQFLRMSLGSAAELETQLIISRELGFISDKDMDDISEKIDHLSRMISSLLARLKY